MAELKTKPTSQSADDFLKSIPDEDRRRECITLRDMMRKATGAEPVMWGAGIVGFGRYHYRYESGREGDWFLTGFAPRKGALTVYIMAGFDQYDDIMQRLGRYKTGKSCLYVRRLADVDVAALEELITESVSHVRGMYPD